MLTPVACNLHPFLVQCLWSFCPLRLSCSHRGAPKDFLVRVEDRYFGERDGTVIRTVKRCCNAKMLRTNEIQHVQQRVHASSHFCEKNPVLLCSGNPCGRRVTSNGVGQDQHAVLHDMTLGASKPERQQDKQRELQGASQSSPLNKHEGVVECQQIVQDSKASSVEGF